MCVEINGVLSKKIKSNVIYFVLSRILTVLHEEQKIRVLKERNELWNREKNEIPDKIYRSWNESQLPGYLDGLSGWVGAGEGDDVETNIRFYVIVF